MIICVCGSRWENGQEQWAYQHWRLVLSHQKRGHKVRDHALQIILPTTTAVLEAVAKYDLDGMPPILGYALKKSREGTVNG